MMNEENATRRFKSPFPKAWGRPPADAGEIELENWILRHIPPGGSYRRSPRVSSRAAKASWVHRPRSRRRRRESREARLEIMAKKYPPEW